MATLYHAFMLALLVAPCGAIQLRQHKPRSAPEKAPALEEITAHNQQTRNSIKQWVTDEDIDGSIFGYGLTSDPKGFAPNTAKDTGDAPIQHDFISQLGARIAEAGEPIRYMEIGVSVLKGMHTQANFFKDAQITAVDIEDPNPSIANFWKNEQVLSEWTDSKMPDGQPDMRRTSGRAKDVIKRWDGPQGNVIHYVVGDAFNAHTYGHLKSEIIDKNGPMNLVVSDGCHTGAAVTAEAENLLGLGIIKGDKAKEFSMVWDDCGGEIAEAVQGGIFARLREEFGKERKLCMGAFSIPGWIGQLEGSHRTCVFSTADLSGEHLGASNTWVADGNEIQCS